MIELDKIYNMDCLEGMKMIPDGSVDCIICDLPYETTCNSWDSIIPFGRLWEQYERIIRDDGVIALFATQPFTTKLIASNMALWRYNWIWEKDVANGFLNVSYAPLKQTEDICVFSKGTIGSLSKNPIRYYPQGVRLVNRTKRNNPNNKYRASQGHKSLGNALNSDSTYSQKYENYPNNILFVPHDKNTFHPTQKPLDLLRYLVLTYSNEGDLILDNCMGSGTTAIACIREKRHFIGFELNEEYYKKSLERIELERQQLTFDF